MTSDSNPPDMPEPRPTPTPEPAAAEPSPVGDAMADARAAFDRAGFSTPAGMVALAGLILVGVEVIFGLILEEYYVDWAVVAVAIAAILVYFGKGAYDGIAPAPDLLKLTGMIIAGLGVLTIIYDLRYAGSRLDDIPEILGALLTYGAFVLAFLGARAIRR